MDNSAKGTSPRTALVTGAARRIGAAIARDLAAHGFAVAVHFHNSQEEAEAVVEAIRADGGRAEAFGADLSDAGQTGQLLALARNRLGPIDLLVNNASVFREDAAAQFDGDVWGLHFAVHARAPAQLAAALAAQDDIDNALIVNMIDQRVWRPNPNFFSYALSKSAMWAQTKTLAQALAPRIRVNAIGPGPSIRSERQAEEDFARQIDGLLLKRGPAMHEFGATVRYFYDTPSITGQMLALDGGQHLAWETPDIAGIPE
ncbi:MAG: SDR family oxidoreductase [Nitratireductor sp.]|nr:SDR family oxidoreductase [Nitratireductor sp.]